MYYYKGSRVFLSTTLFRTFNCSVQPQVNMYLSMYVIFCLAMNTYAYEGMHLCLQSINDLGLCNISKIIYFYNCIIASRN